MKILYFLPTAKGNLLFNQVTSLKLFNSVLVNEVISKTNMPLHIIFQNLKLIEKMRINYRIYTIISTKLSE